MNFKLSTLALLASVIASPLLASEQTVKFDVPGMYCASCPFIVQSAMGDVDGVISVDADSETRTATVVYEDTKTNTDEIAEASTFAGYEATVSPAES